MKSISKILLASLLFPAFVACESGDQEFPDYEIQSVYFAKQYPVRTIELGNDDYVDLTNDNAHKVVIKATMGGAYNNPRDITVKFAVDNSLCDGLKFKSDGSEVTPMPSSFYSFVDDATEIKIPKGEISAGVEVKLNDDFFANPASLKLHYVIPIRILEASGVDTVLSTKDFVLYAVKYINRYHGVYVRQKSGENDADEEFTVTTVDLNTAVLNYPLKDSDGNAHQLKLTLDFPNGSVTTDTEGFTLSNGSVSFTEKDETQMLGAKHPDTIRLKFSASNADLGISENKDVVLNMKYRGVVPETFEVE